MIEIIQLQGTENRLYKLVASLVMNPDVLRKNNNYPFKTTESYTWFIAVTDKKTIGFLPVEFRGKRSAIINNYYVDEKYEEVLPLLISAATLASEADRELSSVTLAEHRSVFEGEGFVVEKEWKRYIKMRKK